MSDHTVDELATADVRATRLVEDEGIHVFTGRTLVFYLIAAVMFAPFALYVSSNWDATGPVHDAATSDGRPPIPEVRP